MSSVVSQVDLVKGVEPSITTAEEENVALAEQGREKKVGLSSLCHTPMLFVLVKPVFCFLYLRHSVSIRTTGPRKKKQT